MFPRVGPSSLKSEDDLRLDWLRARHVNNASLHCLINFRHRLATIIASFVCKKTVVPAIFPPEAANPLFGHILEPHDLQRHHAQPRPQDTLPPPHLQQSYLTTLTLITMATTLAHPHHRKIDLQSPHDLTHLQSQLQTSAFQKLDLHFPPTALSSKPATHIPLSGTAKDTTTPPQAEQSEEEHDPLRAHVSSLLTTFLSRTWSAASHNISINGLDAHTLPQFSHQPFTNAPANASSSTGGLLSATTPTDQDAISQQQPQEGIDFIYEPYDARLQTRLAELYTDLEALTAQVARLRREAPAQGAKLLQTSLATNLGGDEEEEAAAATKDDDDEQRNRDTEKVVEGLKMRMRGTKRKERGEGWEERVGEAYVDAVGELGRLSGRMVVGAGEGGGGGSGGGGLTGCVGKVQRARGVAEEME